MGRSVSSPSNACVVVHAHIEYEEDAELSQMNWDDAVANLRADLMAKDKTFNEAAGWIGNEDRVLLANKRFKVGVSEYCGLVAVWAVPQEVEDEEYGEPLIDAIAHVKREREDAKYLVRLKKWLVEAAGYFGETFTKVGTFSNGEAVSRRAA